VQGYASEKRRTDIKPVLHVHLKNCPSASNQCQSAEGIVSQAKQILYRYNGSNANDEVELDLQGDKTPYMTGDIIDRKGKAWKVEDTVLTQSKSPTELPILTVFLTDKFPTSISTGAKFRTNR
jgi:hypothetical protein